MRPMTIRARATIAGALSMTTLAAAPALAQQAAPAPMPAGAPTAVAAAVPAAKRGTKLRITGRRLNVRAGRTARVSGRLRPGLAGRVVTLERRGRVHWSTIDKARTTVGGRFRLAYRTRTADTARVRVRFAGDRAARPARRAAGRLNAFRTAFASWYGPGLYGNRLGCGGTLGPGTLGVAHKTLPCGTRLTLRHGRRMVRVRVIDRGPYVGGRELDLTAATKARLGFGSTGTVEVAH